MLSTTIKERLAVQAKQHGIELSAPNAVEVIHHLTEKYFVRNASYRPAIEAIDRAIADSLSELVLHDRLPTAEQCVLTLSILGQKAGIKVDTVDGK